MGSNFMTTKGSSSDSLNGLKFGQKIYFEDVGVGVSGKSGKKNGKGVAQNGQPPRCQVEGCNVDLSDAKAYYSRHKVCGMHSKSPLVIVNGIEQRFCQQCSRFHQLPEFDQGKRSCRRRLAGHNERRRKPPPGSLLSSRLGRLSSSLFGDSTSRSGFLLDFSSYSRNSERELWPGSKTSEAVSGIQSSSSLEKFHHNLWPGNSENPPSEMYMQSSAGGSSFPIPSGECITGVSSDSTCALSLLSNQTWSSSNGASATGLGNLMNHGGASVSQHTPTQTVTVAHLPNIHETDIRLHGASSDHLGPGQFSHPLNSDHLFMEQVHGGRHYMEVDHSNGYSSASASQVHWSL